MSHAKRNWSQYNRSLVNKGSLTIWIDSNYYEQWINLGRRGRPKFDKSVIKIGWILKTVYRLTYRALEGFFGSILKLMKLPHKVPNYTLFCKRANEVLEELPKLSKRRPTDLVVDSSGLKVYGEGEWKVKVHGRDKPRKWIKAHIAVDPQSQEIIALEVTESTVGDATVLPTLLEKTTNSVKRVFADGAYDRLKCRQYLHNHGIEGTIPPPKNACIRQKEALSGRNDAIKTIRYFGGDKVAKSIWKKLVGYHKRSLVETAFSSLKRFFGDRLQSLKKSTQTLEITLRCWSLNRIRRLNSGKI
jgi:hypothetical protein